MLIKHRQQFKGYLFKNFVPNKKRKSNKLNKNRRFTDYVKDVKPAMQFL